MKKSSVIPRRNDSMASIISKTSKNSKNSKSRSKSKKRMNRSNERMKAPSNGLSNITSVSNLNVKHNRNSSQVSQDANSGPAPGAGIKSTEKQYY